MDSIREIFQQKRWDILLLMLAAFFPIYKYSVSALMLALVALASVYVYYHQPVGSDRVTFPIKLRYFLINTFFYWMLIASLLYTSNISKGVSSVTTNLYLLIYPLAIIFFVDRISKRHVNLILSCFVIACVCYMLYIQYQFFVAGLFEEFQPATFYDLPFRTVLMDLKTGNGHPTYVSMWFLFASLFLIHHLLVNRTILWYRMGLVLIVVLLVSASVLLSAKITILAFGFSLLLMFWLVIKNKIILIATLVLTILTFFLSVFNISFLRARFIDEFQATELKPPVGIATNSLNIRVGIFECSMTVFKNNWLIGTGAGDTQDELDKCYVSFDTDVYTRDNYNTHNAYLNIAVSTGLLGLVTFLLMVAVNARDALRCDNTFVLVFLLYVLICMLPENILSRNHGVVFFSLFSSIFVKTNIERLNAP